MQSHEIRFGDAFETFIEEYLRFKGCEILLKKLNLENGDRLNVDQYFKYQNKVYFIEQKVRDDHDSTKKRGQIENFEKKLNLIISLYPESEVIGIFYFIDPDLSKNKNYYITELAKMKDDYQVETHIFYGKALFDYLDFADIWTTTLEYLALWKVEIPDLPEINFDLDAEATFEEIKDLKPLIYRKLFDNEQVFEQIVTILFPQNKTLHLLVTYFEQQPLAIYKTLAVKLRSKLK